MIAPSTSRLLAPIATAALVALHLAWEFTHSGIARHHFLANKDLPAISNAWGLLALPLLAWFTVVVAQRAQRGAREVAPRFIAGALIGALVAILFSANVHEPLLLILVAALLLAACFSGDRLESLLGFSLAMMITFGGILPLIVGGVILGMARAIRWIGLRIFQLLQRRI